jgi:hypothetical protein
MGDNSHAAAAAAAAELRQMSSCNNPAYGRLANFDIDRKVSNYHYIRRSYKYFDTSSLHIRLGRGSSP